MPQLELFFILFVLSISLPAAGCALFILFRLHRQLRLPFLLSYFLYLVFLLFFGFYGLAATHLARLIFPGSEQAAALRLLARFLPFLAIPFLVVALYLYVRLFRELGGKRLPASFTAPYFVLQGLFILGYGFYLSESGIVEVNLFLSPLEAALLVSDLLVSSIALYHGFTGWKSHPVPMVRDAARNFTFFQLILKIIRYNLLLAAGFSHLVRGLYILVVCAGDLPVVIYLRSRLRTAVLEGDGLKPGSGSDRILQEQYGISARELEIIRMICRGKSNKAIARELDISLQTVKTHIHRIYQKTGVSNRVQLSNLVSFNR